MSLKRADTQSGVYFTNNNDALQEMAAMGMKIGDPTFNMKNMMKLDLHIDLSMLQTAISYLLKTTQLHDKEIIELRQANASQEKQLNKQIEEFKEYASNESRKIEMRKIKQDLESMVVEKTVEYDDVIGKLREEVDKLKNSKHPRFVRKGTFNKNHQSSMNLQGENVETPQNLNNEIDNIDNFQTSIQKIEEKVNEVNMKLNLILTTSSNNTSSQPQIAQNNTNYSHIFQFLDSMKKEFEQQYVKKYEFRQSQQYFNQRSDEEETFEDFRDQLQNIRQQLMDKVEQDDFDNFVAQFQGTSRNTTANYQYQENYSEKQDDLEMNQEVNILNSGIASAPIRSPKEGIPQEKLNDQIFQQAIQKVSKIAVKNPQQKQSQVVLPMAPDDKKPQNKIIVGMGSKEQKQIKEMSYKIPDIEKQIQQIKSEIRKMNIEQIRDELLEINQTLEKKATILELKKNVSLTDEINKQLSDLLLDLKDQRQSEFWGDKGKQSYQILKKVELLTENSEIKMTKIIQNVTEFQQRINDTMKLMMIGNNKDDDQQMDEKFQREIRQKAEQAIQECQKIKIELLKAMNILETKVASKANREEIEKIDDHFSTCIDQVVATCKKKYMDKKEGQRLQRDIDSLQKQFYDNRNVRSRSSRSFSQGKNEMKTAEQDVLLAKKPLGGWSCASCGTNIPQMQNMPSQDYNIWSKLPNKDINLLNQKLNNGKVTHTKSLSKFKGKQMNDDIEISARTHKVIKLCNQKKNQLDIPLDCIKGCQTERGTNVDLTINNEQIIVKDERPSSQISYKKVSNTNLPKIIIRKNYALE